MKMQIFAELVVRQYCETISAARTEDIKILLHAPHDKYTQLFSDWESGFLQALLFRIKLALVVAISKVNINKSLSPSVSFFWTHSQGLRKALLEFFVFFTNSISGEIKSNN